MRTGVPPLVHLLPLAHLPWNVTAASSASDELAVAWEGLPPPWEVYHWTTRENVQLWEQNAWPRVTMADGLTTTRLLQLHAMGGVAADATSVACAHQGESEFLSAWAGWHAAEVQLVMVRGPSQQLMDSPLASTPGHPFLAFALQHVDTTARRQPSSLTAVWDAFVAEHAACADVVQRQTRIYELDEWRENVAAWSGEHGATDQRDCGAARKAEREAAGKAAREAVLSGGPAGGHDSQQPSEEWKRWAREWAGANMRNDKSQAQRITELAAI